jgi:arsenite methyltransferase
MRRSPQYILFLLNTHSIAAMSTTSNNENIRQTVLKAYEQIATTQGQQKSCCSSFGGKREDDAFAKKIGYTAEELAALPEGANMGLSCGNPTAIASLMEGETVLDLGCGGGFDVFIAAKKVGPTGRSIGVDMSPAMIHKARQNSLNFQKRTDLTNVEFRLGEIEHLPAADSSIDVIISNCVVNLSPEKEQVWRDVARVLKPGGRACISDIALLQPLPESLRKSIAALVGCVAGAALVEDVVRMVNAAGLVVTSAERESAFIQQMETSGDPLYKNIMKDAPEGTNPHDYVTSLRLVATKPFTSD